jgi:hypothetical protein
MIRPFTCICLMLAAGSGLYLYQVKQRAFALDADLRSTFHDIDMAREKTRMLRADWALMNDPERLQTLSDQYLALKPMVPSQLMTLEQLAASLPAPLPPGSPKPATPDAAAPAAPATDLTHGLPMASASPAGSASGAAVAMLQPLPAAPLPASSPAVSAEAAPPPVASDETLATSAAADASVAVAAPSSAPAQPELSAVTPHVAHHFTKRVQTAKPNAGHSGPQPWAPAGIAGSSLADAGGAVPQVAKPHHLRHKPAAPRPGAQYFAANDTTRPAPFGGERITPPAATVMYSSAGSSLGMASAAALAPPRPLYSTSQ